MNESNFPKFYKPRHAEDEKKEYNFLTAILVGVGAGIILTALLFSIFLQI